MKKMILPIWALLFTMLTSSCNSGALVFNNRMVEVQKSLEPKLLAFGNKMGMLGEDDSIKIMANDATMLIQDLDKGIEKIKALEAPKSGEEFKRSMLAQLEYMKNFCKQTIQLGDAATSQEEKQKIAADFLKAEQEVTRLEEDTQAKQKAFAKANGFRLQ